VGCSPECFVRLCVRGDLSTLNYLLSLNILPSISYLLLAGDLSDQDSDSSVGEGDGGIEFDDGAYSVSDHHVDCDQEDFHSLEGHSDNEEDEESGRVTEEKLEVEQGDERQPWNTSTAVEPSGEIILSSPKSNPTQAHHTFIDPSSPSPFPSIVKKRPFDLLSESDPPLSPNPKRAMLDPRPVMCPSSHHTHTHNTEMTSELASTAYNERYLQNG
jgi:hypothetical protein